MTTLVAGGTGYYGMWICRELAERGDDVIAFDLYGSHPEDRRWSPELGEYAVPAPADAKRQVWTKAVSKNIMLECGDVRTISDLITVFKEHKVDSVVNTVAHIHGFGATPAQRLHTNVMGTFNLLEAARAFGVRRFTHITSSGVYPGKQFYQDKWKGNYEPVTEDHPVSSAYTHATDYHATQVFRESFGIRYHDLYGLDFVSLRTITGFGPGRRLWRHHPGNYTKVLMDAAAGRETHFEFGGDTYFDPIYVRDLAEGIAAVHLAKSLKHQIYNLVYSEPITVNQFLATIGEVTGLSFSAGPGEFPGPPEPKGWISRERIKQEIGWEPRFTRKAAIAEYIEHLRAGGCNGI
jgi:dTDP-glucose 4,6-dehydratase